ncbi:MAG: hypothetical protein ACPGRC_10120 [Salibacteraceae bacterium]
MIRFNQSIGRFSIYLFITLVISFGIHFGYLIFLGSDTNWVEIATTYGVNFILGLSITLVLYKLKDKYAHSLGFIFMGGSMFKFLIFFMALQPIYKADGNISSLEFGYFFIPYGISLAFETLFISQILNETKYD